MVYCLDSLRAFRLSFPSQSGGIDWVMTIHREMFALLASYGFSFEIGGQGFVDVPMEDLVK